MQPLSRIVRERCRPPIAIVMGSPASAADLALQFPGQDVTCFQMDLYPADRLSEQLAGRESSANVVTAADLWDLPGAFQTAIYLAVRGGERELKLDMIEQAFHILRPHGTFLVHSPVQADTLFPAALKKVFRRVHAASVEDGQAFWCFRDGERPRRRHEVTFHVRMPEGESLRFLSRPGVFSYGRFDLGARALVEIALINPGDRIVDVGCGCGTNGVWAGKRSGAGGHVAFVDSNLRAVALAEHNARTNGLDNFEVFATSTVQGPTPKSVDVALANPPYYAQGAIARLFAERCRELLRPGGRFYLVTKQADQIGPIAAEVFGPVEVMSRRGYAILCARA